jgi:hypothetical protein
MSSNERLYYPIENIRNTFSKVSISSFYKIAFQLSNNGNRSGSGLINWLNASGIYDSSSSNGLNSIEFIELLCSGAILPGTSFKMTEVMGNRQGILEKYPVFKQYPELALTFYVDVNHKVIKFFEEWTNYITPLYNPNSGRVSVSKNGLNSKSASQENDYIRMRYPNQYTQTIYITKFERDLNTVPVGGKSFSNSPTLSYKFIKAYPSNIIASPVSYNGSDILSYTVNFAYSRYFVINTDRVFGSSLVVSDASTRSISSQSSTLNIDGVDQVVGNTRGFDANIA